MGLNTNLKLEAQAFDEQIEERIKNGHIPDLRYSKPCNYFYNNPWRHPFYVSLDFGEIFDLIINSIEKYLNISRNTKILEVGCGPGYLTLELARNGLNVTGIDLSEKAINYAKYYSEIDPHKNERGKLEYFVENIFEFNPNEKFDVILFVGALHHFNDQIGILSKCEELLNSNGLIICHEPTRDRVNKGNAAFMHLLRTLLSVSNGFYANSKIEVAKNEILDSIEGIFKSMKYETENGRKKQSINDNEAGFETMFTALSDKFEEIQFIERYSFFHEIVGGLRFDQETNNKVATYLREMDKILCDFGVLQSTEFYFVGKKL